MPLTPADIIEIEKLLNKRGRLSTDAVATASAAYSGFVTLTGLYASRGQLGSGSYDSTKYLRGDGSWQTPAGAGELAMSANAPVNDVTIPANNTAVVSGVYTQAAGKTTYIGTGATLVVL